MNTWMRLVRSELLKVRSTRLWWGLLIGVVGLSAVQAGVTAGFAGVDLGAGQGTAPGLDEPETIRGVYASAAFAGAYIFALVLGITGMTGEYRYQTATPTFLASPKRSRVVLAKGVAQLGFGLLYGAIALAAAVLVGGVVIAVRGHDLGFGTPGLLRAVVLGVVAVGLWGLIGMGIGTIGTDGLRYSHSAIAPVFASSVTPSRRYAQQSYATDTKKLAGRRLSAPILQPMSEVRPPKPIGPTVSVLASSITAVSIAASRASGLTSSRVRNSCSLAWR